MAMVIASGVSIDGEIIPYLDHKLSKNKWKSKKVAKKCRNRQARSNGSNRNHRQRYCHQSQIARKGVVPSSNCKNLKHKRRLTNDSFINESMLNDIFNTSQSTLEEQVNYYTNDDNGQTFIDPKLLVLASPKRRRRKKKSKHYSTNGSITSSSSLGLEDTPSMSVFTASEDSHSSDVDLGYYYVPNDYSKYLETNDNSSTSKSKSTLVKVNNYDSDSSDDSDDSDNWTPWPSSKPDPKYAVVIPAPPKPTVASPFNPPAPVKKPKPKKIVPKDDVDQFPDFNIEEELKLLGLEEEKAKVQEAKKDDDSESEKDKDKDKDKEQEKDVSVNSNGNQADETNETDKDQQVEAVVDGDKDKQNENSKKLETENESDKKQESKEAEMKEISVLEERYRNEIDKIEELNEYAPIEGLASRSSFKEYNKDDETTQMDPKTLKKVFKEIKVELPKNIVIQWNGSMFVRFDEENPRFLQALLTGLDDTPYENGLFLFDIYLHKDYPNSPLKIKHVTKGGNMVYGNHTPGGFSPNLHRDSGKVCLSLLGTWGTNQWDPKTSNIYQVLSSILFWIFGAKWAYYMEPSYGGWELTAPMSENDASKHKKEVITYNYEVIEKCMKYAILETIRTPYTGFDEVTKVHFKVKKNIILKTILTKWIKDAPSIKVKNKLIPLYKDIKEELNKL